MARNIVYSIRRVAAGGSLQDTAVTARVLERLRPQGRARQTASSASTCLTERIIKNLQHPTEVGMSRCIGAAAYTARLAKRRNYPDHWDAQRRGATACMGHQGVYVLKEEQ